MNVLEEDKSYAERVQKNMDEIVKRLGTEARLTLENENVGTFEKCLKLCLNIDRMHHARNSLSLWRFPCKRLVPLPGCGGLEARSGCV